MQYVLYFLIAIGATTVGSLTGMGGGVIIKPLMDVLHGFDVQTIGVLSSLTVFSMSVVSIGKQMLARTKIPFSTAIPLALGSVVGGLAGEHLLQLIVDALQANAAVTVVQNVVLGLLILLAVMGLIYLFFFVHNRAWLTAAAFESALAGSMDGIREEGRSGDTARMRGRELGSTGFFGAENLDVQVTDGKEIKVVYTADTISGFGRFSWKMKAEGSSRVIKPVEWIRKIKSAADIVDGD